MPTYQASEKGYSNLWDRADVIRITMAKEAAQTIIKNKARYKTLERQSGVPWFVTAPIHYREASFSFRTHLHNGDPLSARTVHVPRGKPEKGSPPFTWEESATDAITTPPHQLQNVGFWSVERVLFEQERYNGWGYLGKCNSPYVWAGTDQYDGGMYVADHVFNPSKSDPRVGTAAILKELAALDGEVAAALSRREPVPSKETQEELKKVKKEATKKERTTAAGGAVGTTVGSGSKMSHDAPLIVTSMVEWGLIGFGLTLALIAVVLIVQKHRAVNKLW